MEADFWHDRWGKNEIGFHENEVNQLLVETFKALDLEKGSRIFLPLCGKTRDIAWLHSQGQKVVGIELSEDAVKQLFEDLGQTPEITQIGKLSLYSTEDIEIFVGDFFNLSKEQLGQIDAVYDRASLIALPETMREKYAQHLVAITATVPQLLITLEYDQSALNGPPFSIDETMINDYYENHFNWTELMRIDEDGKFKGKVEADNVAWHLVPKLR